MVLDGCYGQKWSDSVFQVPNSCPICLTPIHWPERTQCGHVFHKRCLLQHLSNLQSIIERLINTMLSHRKMGEWLLERSIAGTIPSSPKARRRRTSFKREHSNGEIQRAKLKRAKHETRKLKWAKREMGNNETLNIKWGKKKLAQANREMGKSQTRKLQIQMRKGETGRPKQAKHAMETSQARNEDRPNMK
ncbi:hypothetical protein TNCV_820011 [Trichonephila clavipes]|nr:hypothetical protein TNCV_820011 [Trichonephila clavipes]